MIKSNSIQTNTPTAQDETLIFEIGVSFETRESPEVVAESGFLDEELH